MEAIGSVAEARQGKRAERHVHQGVGAGCVLQGTIVCVGGKAPAMMATGSSIVDLRDVRDVRHGGDAIVGDAPLNLAAVHVVDQGAPLRADAR